MSNVLCRVRFYVPNNAASTDAGQVDLGIQYSVPHFGTTVSNPVYSYRGNNTILVFPASKMSQNCPYMQSGEYTVKQWDFYVNSSTIATFGSLFDSYVTRDLFNTTLQRATCITKSNYRALVNYDPNGFGAVALLAHDLGKNQLWSYYTNPNDTRFVAYLPVSLESYGVATNQWISMDDQHDI